MPPPAPPQEFGRVTLRFYIDDSGKNDPPVFVLGGWVIDSGSVEAFSDEWSAALEAPPAIPHFKMKEAHGRRGAFKGMSVEARDAKVRTLSEVLLRRAIATLSVIVRHEDYRRVYEGQMMRSMDRPYQMLFHLVIATGYKLRNELGLTGRAEFVFDRQLEHERALRESFAVMERGMLPEMREFLVAAPRHADDKNEPALQAADLVAWHVRRSWREGTEALRRASTAGPAIAAIPGKHDLFNEGTLRYLAQVATKTVRDLNTVFPYEAKRITTLFDMAATIANFELMADARPFEPVELISFPAIGTGRFRLVSSCAALGRPHLHRRSGNSCLGEASAG